MSSQLLTAARAASAASGQLLRQLLMPAYVSALRLLEQLSRPLVLSGTCAANLTPAKTAAAVSITALYVLSGLMHPFKTRAT